MEAVFRHLSILSKAVHYKNLSGAAHHVGLSQPQLSRIIAVLESELKLLLLDRSARRNTSWTKAAYLLAEIYDKSEKNMQYAITAIAEQGEPKFLRIGMLEGLKEISLNFCQRVLKKTKIEVLELDVYDLNQLEELFLNEDLDIIFSSREPGRKKTYKLKQFGYQTMELIERNKEFQILSLYQYRTIQQKKKKRTFEKAVISNSLAVRKLWIEKFGGFGTFPSAVYTKKHGTANEQNVYMIANERLPQTLWQTIVGHI